MNDFIEIHVSGERRLVNIRHVEDIWEKDNGKAEIYFSGNAPGAVEPYHVTTDETYEKIRSMIWG